MNTDTNTNKDREKLLTTTAEKASKLRDLDAEIEQTRKDLGKAVLDAREAGYVWIEIQKATHQSRAQLEWAIARYRGVDTKARPRRTVKNLRDSGPGMSVSEAARVLGISRQGVYLRIAQGKLRTATNEVGIVRVLGLDDKPTE